MDALALLRRAKEAGLRVEPAGDKLVVRGPKYAEPVVKLLAENKVEVLAVLADTARRAELLAPSPWFERAIPPAEGEPGLEQPSAARRGRVERLSNDLYLHFCAECGAWGAFGYALICVPAGLGVGTAPRIGRKVLRHDPAHDLGRMLAPPNVCRTRGNLLRRAEH